MVSLGKENAYDLRQHLHAKVLAEVGNDPFKSSWLAFLRLREPPAIEMTTSPLYLRCGIAGLEVIAEAATTQDLTRLLGQAPKIDSTPRPWVSDVIGVLAIKWFVDQQVNSATARQFSNWCDGFLGNQITSSKFDEFEHDIAMHIRDKDTPAFSTAAIPLFLHYRGKLRIEDHKSRLQLIEKFMNEFHDQAKHRTSSTIVAAMIYVFDQIGHDVALVPPTGWALSDLVVFLEKIPVGLRKWTWEETPRTKGAAPIRWLIDNEYHVQNLLYALLGPVFNDISDEVYIEPVGQKTPRVDLYLPTLHTIIEVKYRKNTKTSFQRIISEIAEDASLYRSDQKHKDAKIVVFLWDQSRATQEHSKFREGVLKLPGVNACVVVNAPSDMEPSS